MPYNEVLGMTMKQGERLMETNPEFRATKEGLKAMQAAIEDGRKGEIGVPFTGKLADGTMVAGGSSNTVSMCANPTTEQLRAGIAQKTAEAVAVLDFLLDLRDDDLEVVTLATANGRWVCAFKEDAG